MNWRAKGVLVAWAILMPMHWGNAVAAVRDVSYTPIAKADRVLVLKAEHKMYLLREGEIMRVYPVALGFQPHGPKHRQGDGRTPEGSYHLDHRNTASAYYRSIHISYPNQHDAAEARRMGVATGGDVMIHGVPNWVEGDQRRHLERDWTHGCIAVTDAEMDEIWQATDEGTPIEIRP